MDFLFINAYICFMDLFNFFLDNNKGGEKTNPKFLENNFNELFNKIENHLNDQWFKELSFKEKIWYFINNKKERVICLKCGNNVKYKGTLKKGYSKYCSLECANLDQKNIYLNTTIKTNESKYNGLSHYSKTDEFKKRVKNTKLLKFNNENYNNLEKNRKTKLLKYGNEFFNNQTKKNETTKKRLILNYENKSGNKILSWVKDDIKSLCSTCNTEFTIYHNLLNYRINNKINPCTNCNPISDLKSIKEKDLLEFIKTITNKNIVNSNRDLIKPYEIDILIDEIKLGIEFNGLYYHSDRFKNKDYHINKLKSCNNLGYDLITIFEDEWLNKTNIVKSILINRISPNLNQRVFARNCEIKEIKDLKTVKDFLNENHLQGFTNYKISYGLFLNDNLISLITLGHNRIALGYKNTNHDEFELLRFVNKIGFNVIGGFSKLIKHFLKNNEVKNIITYSDNRLFNGKVYEKNGFNFISNTSPNYFYCKNNQRFNRYKFRKSELVKKGMDVEKTEKEIMLELGYNRIYDCGSKKFILNNLT